MPAAYRSCWVRWCGLMLNTSSLELMADYTRYSGQHISTALTLNRGRAGERPGRLLLSKVNNDVFACTSR